MASGLRTGNIFCYRHTQRQANPGGLRPLTGGSAEKRRWQAGETRPSARVRLKEHSRSGGIEGVICPDGASYLPNGSYT